MNGKWCPGSWQYHSGDRCQDCGRITNQNKPIIDPQTGRARYHMELSFTERRRAGLIPSQVRKKS